MQSFTSSKYIGDTACCNTTTLTTMSLISPILLEVLPHPPYSHDLVPSGYRFFLRQFPSTTTRSWKRGTMVSSSQEPENHWETSEMMARCREQWRRIHYWLTHKHFRWEMQIIIIINPNAIIQQPNITSFETMFRKEFGCFYLGNYACFVISWILWFRSGEFTFHFIRTIFKTPCIYMAIISIKNFDAWGFAL